MLFSRSRLTSILTCGLFVGILSVSLSAQAAGDFTGYLYVSDYGSQLLDRFSYDYHSTTNSISNILPAGYGGDTTNAAFIAGNIQSGIQGTGNDIIVVINNGASLARYDLEGNLIGTINVTNNDNSPHTFNSIGSIVITHDGKFLYAPDAGNNAINKIDLATGKIVNSTAFTGAHDIAINPTTGTIYAAAYNSADPGSVGVWALPSDLSSKTQLITTAGGLTSPTGITVAADGSLYIQQNVHTISPDVAGGPDGVYHYTLSNGSAGATATFDATHSLTSSASLHSTFGNSIGPDGNIYIAALGGGSGSGGNSGYTDGLYKF
ncbi:MAG: hypothetical protein JWN14_3258, partial [Chthonomonadales bacterium]|nr:hypothetical protein [Chthonomonadales bacterium]